MAARINLLLLSFQFLSVASTTFRQTQGDTDSKEADIGIQFSVEPDDLVVARGKQAILHCLAHSMIPNEKLYISWTFNGTQLNLNNDNRRFVHRNGSLVFNKVVGRRQDAISDEGIYRCVASISNAVLVSRPAELKIAVFSRELYVAPAEAAVPQGDTVRLTCNLDSVPAADISWTFQDAPLPPSNNKYKYNTLVPGVLYITDVQHSDSGEYRCICKNAILKRSRRSSSCKLKVNVKSTNFTSLSNLEFLSTPLPKFIVVRQNQNMILDCSASGPTNEINLFWTYAQTDAAKKTILTNATAGVNVFKKTNVGVTDSGLYTCIASPIRPDTNVYSISQVVKVDVITPPVIIKRPKSKTLPVALRVRFECEATGHPRPDISWLRNGQKLHINGRIKQIENELVLINTVLGDSGIYQCVATNQYGSTWAASHLFVVGSPFQPAPPTGISCIPLNSTQILVSWELSPHDSIEQPPIIIKEQDLDSLDNTDGGHDPVLSFQPTITKAYSVHYYPTDGGEEFQELSVNQSIVIGRLQPNKNYTVYIRTYNGVSGSDHSEQIICHTTDEADQSLQVTADVVGPMSIFLKWFIQSKSKTKDENMCYKVQWKKKLPFSSNIEEVAVNSTSHVIPDLVPGIQYEVRVLGTINEGNIVLESQWITVSVPSIPTIPSPILDIIIVNSTCLQVTWKIPDKVKFDSLKLSCTREDSNSPLNINLPPNQNSFLLSALEPGVKYEISLRTVFNFEEGPISMKTLTMPSSKHNLLSPPTNLRAESLSPNSISVSWLPPAETVVLFYLISYNQFDSVQQLLTSSNSTILITGLLPYTLYEIKVRVYGQNNTYSNFSDTVQIRTLYDVPGIVENISWHVLNSSSIRVNWREPGDLHGIISYIVSYTSLLGTPPHLWTHVPVREGAFTVDITGLKPNTKYFVMVKASSEMAGNGEPQIISVIISKPGSKISAAQQPTSTTTTSNSIMNKPIFTADQWIGIYIGIAISCFCLLSCIGFLYIRKKHYDKRKMELQRERDNYFSENHEMIVLPKNPNNFAKAPHLNGGTYSVTMHLPLLATSNVVNTVVPNARITDNPRFFDMENGEIITEEMNTLLNSDLIGNETAVSELDVTEQDQEGGDSGYCDRRNSQSPQLRDTGTFPRKNSDITDGGFYENDTQSSIHNPLLNEPNR